MLHNKDKAVNQKLDARRDALLSRVYLTDHLLQVHPSTDIADEKWDDVFDLEKVLHALNTDQDINKNLLISTSFYSTYRDICNGKWKPVSRLQAQIPKWSTIFYAYQVL